MILRLKSVKEFITHFLTDKKTDKKDFHVYLLIGQSNMAGRAPLPEKDTDTVQRGYLLNSDDMWEPARNPLNRYSSIESDIALQKLGPGYTFLKTMLNDNINIEIGLVVNARGGVSIQKWVKGSHFFNEAVRRARIAKRKGVLKGIVWHQGETDELDGQYLDKLKQFVIDLRRELDHPDLPFIAGEIRNVELINKQIMQLPHHLSCTGAVSSEGLSCIDYWHFDTESVKLLGKRYALEMKQLQRALNN